MAKKLIVGAAAIAAVALTLAGCAPTTDTGSNTSSALQGDITGEITVLTQRTDLVDTVFQDYKKSFEAKYPGTTVKFEAITDYEGDVSTRLTSGNVGDVLLIPNTVTRDQLPTFFEPLGTVDDLSSTYRFLNEQSFDGNAYGIAITGNAQGIVYNKKVWAAAGVTEWPTTTDEFIADLQAIKANTDATPLYTNYAAGWPMTQWEGNRGITADTDANLTLVNDDSPWAAGKYHDITDGLLYDVVADGLVEADPTTTDWESSKGLIGSGKVATMVLGSWAITQMQDAAVTAGASADDIAYMPFPYQVDGKFHSTIGGDYKNAISISSTNKPTAWAWIQWFAAESNYASDQGGLSPLVGGESASTLADFDAKGVEYVELNSLPADQATAETDITSESEIDLWGPIYRQKLVDIARGAAKGDKASYFAELNQRWADAKASIG
jgi:raffinose/stachyose/melibiose transport system substrate-binding protein